jgi:hypothetical protein
MGSRSYRYPFNRYCSTAGPLAHRPSHALWSQCVLLA